MTPVARRLCVLIFALSSTASSQVAVAQGVDQSFDQGTAALKAGKYEAAVLAFTEVWKTRKTHDVAANLALAEAQLGRHRDAAEHFAFALRNFPVTGNANVKKGIEDAFAQSKNQVTAVRVSVSADGAEVLVDGQNIGRSPLVDEIYLEPGAHTIEARLAGYTTTSRKLDAKKGSVEAVQLTLSQPPPPPPPPPPTGTATGTVPPPPARNVVPALVAGGVSAVSLIAGGVLFGVSATNGAELRAGAPRGSDGQLLCRKTPQPTSSTTPECDAWRAKASEAATLGNAGIGLFVVGGVAAAGAVAAFLFWPPSTTPRSSVSLQVVPVLGAEGGGALVRGKF